MGLFATSLDVTVYVSSLLINSTLSLHEKRSSRVSKQSNKGGVQVYSSTLFKMAFPYLTILCKHFTKARAYNERLSQAFVSLPGFAEHGRMERYILTQVHELNSVSLPCSRTASLKQRQYGIIYL